MNRSKFMNPDGSVNIGLLEEWAENYYHQLLYMMNPFLSKLDPAETIERLKAMNLGDLVHEALEDEPEEAQLMAGKIITDLLHEEISYFEAYLDK
ncbi:MAG: hypothetical protein ACM3UZ_09995 [Acidobacteriota bacterium]